ncbi:putative metal-dependent hydrolase [Robertkochia marina]|uniref:Putative metal-dependent hydrolase n=1 Tax=Robertkochia marina TaxID=1227945 RepID=A0A4S3LY18_9FLAO|nr:putative metal-dependent hydrolase [Robertkochia marina]THD65821.1 putative metal-dependent hydrolase [Robertkochia marina]TRZ41324.1 putative metal-dependent hydrolase [Robertkochia marina]
MEDQQLEELKYPIGRFALPEAPGKEEIQAAIAVIEVFPSNLEKTVKSLTDEQLDTPYRPGGWTIRQVVHHVADSHTNAYIRFKWGLTEDTPRIRTYKEDRWATLADVDGTPVEPSMTMLRALHAKWVLALKHLNPEQWKRSIFHPGFDKEITLAQLVCQYSWHSRHHLAHVNHLLARKGWVS